MPFETLIGTGVRVITPELGCQMAGFDARKGTAQSVHDDLHSRALVLDDGTTRLALVSVELLGLDRPFADNVRGLIEQRTKIPAGNVVLAATHTHCGPATSNHFYNQGQPLDRAYLSRLGEEIVRSVDEASAACRPRRIRAGFVPVEGIAVNRRSGDGKPVDPNAGVLLIEEADGSPAAVAVNFACHTTVLGPNTLAISADFPFYTIRKLERVLGAPALFFNGAEGDISVGHRSDLSAVGVIAPFRTFEKAEELGTRLADGVLEGLAGLEDEMGKLFVSRSRPKFPLKRYAPLPKMRADREAAAEALLNLNNENELLRARQRSLYCRIEEYYASLYENADGPEPKVLPAELMCVRIGDTALLSFPGEVFVSIALDIRARSPFPRTMFLGLANDYIGYIPTADANAGAGYEVVASRLAPEAAGILSAAAGDLLQTVRQAQ